MIGAALLLGAALAAAPPQTGDASIDGFVADLAAGRRDAALPRILEMNSVSGRPNAVALASQFVDKLIRCTLVSYEVRNFGGEMFDLRWRCADGDYFSLLDSGYRPPRIVVGQFLSAAEHGARRPAAIAVPMPYVAEGPALSDEEKVRMVTDYLDGLRPGGSIFRTHISFRLEFMDRREPDSFISPGQLGQFLAPCRRAVAPGVPRDGPHAGRVVVRWTCTGRGALDTEITTAMSPYQGRITGGLVIVGREAR